MLAGRMRMAASGVVVGGDAQYSIDFNGASTKIDCGSDASLDDLADNEFTNEVWYKADSAGEGGSGFFFEKGFFGTGFYLSLYGDGGLYAVIEVATTDALTWTYGGSIFPIDSGELQY